jgi:hypothetical protein
LIDSQKKVIGVFFPTAKADDPGRTHSDQALCSLWSRMPNALRNTEIFAERVSLTDKGPVWDKGPSEPAPWADSAYGYAENSAKVLHSAGFNHDVHATVGINTMEANEERGTAEIGVVVINDAAASESFIVIRKPSPDGTGEAQSQSDTSTAP